MVLDYTYLDCSGYKMIFQLQHEIAELRETIINNGFVKNPAQKAITAGNSTESKITSILKYHGNDDITPSVTVETPVITPPPSSPTTLEDNEKETIRRALERNDGRRGAAAKELKISERTLYRKIRDYGLE